FFGGQGEGCRQPVQRLNQRLLGRNEIGSVRKLVHSLTKPTPGNPMRSPCFPRSLKTLASSAAVFFTVAASVPAVGLPAPDFSAARDETVKILSDFIKVDTSNPPGNETK